MTKFKIFAVVLVALAFPASAMAGAPGAVKTFTWSSGQIDVPIPVRTPAIGPRYADNIVVTTEAPEGLGIVDSCAGTPMAGMCNNIPPAILSVEYKLYVTGLGTGTGIGSTGNSSIEGEVGGFGNLELATTETQLGTDCAAGMHVVTAPEFAGDENVGGTWRLKLGSLSTDVVLHCWALTITYQEDPKGQLGPAKPTYTSCRERQPRIAKLSQSGLTCAGAERFAMQPKLRGDYNCVSHGLTTCTNRTDPAVAFRYEYVPVMRRCGTEASTGLTKIVSFDASCLLAKQVARGAMRVHGGWGKVGVWKRLPAPRGWKCSYWTNPVRWHCNNGRGARVNFEPGPGF